MRLFFLVELLLLVWYFLVSTKGDVEKINKTQYGNNEAQGVSETSRSEIIYLKNCMKIKIIMITYYSTQRSHESLVHQAIERRIKSVAS